MATHKLVPYWLRLRESRDTDNWWDLDNLTNECDSFTQDSIIGVFADFFDQYNGDLDDDEEKRRTFEVHQVEDDDTTIEGEINYGEYGIEADVWDREEEERIEAFRQKHHSLETPYYFFAGKPGNVDTHCIVVLKQYKVGGVKGDLHARLKSYIEDIYEDTYFHFKPAYNQDAEEMVLNSDEINKLTFRGEQELTPVEEHAENEGVSDVERKTVDRKYTITPTDDERLTPDFVLSFLPNQNWKYGELDKNDFSDVKATVEKDDSNFTFSLWETNISMRRELDPVEDNLVMDGGHPTAESLSPVARELANYVLPPEADDLDGDTIL